MKKLALALVALLVLAALGLLGVASLQPDVVAFERSRTMPVAVEDVWPHVADHRLAAEWSPWSEKDPAMTREFSEPSTGVGATTRWSGNDEVGTGSLTNTAVVDHASVDQSLAFTAPWESQARCGFALSGDGESTTVTWWYEQDADFALKLMLLSMDLEERVAPDYERGLERLEQAAVATRDVRVASAPDPQLAALAETLWKAEASDRLWDTGGAEPPSEEEAAARQEEILAWLAEHPEAAEHQELLADRLQAYAEETVDEALPALIADLAPKPPIAVEVEDSPWRVLVDYTHAYDTSEDWAWYSNEVHETLSARGVVTGSLGLGERGVRVLRGGEELALLELPEGAGHVGYLVALEGAEPQLVAHDMAGPVLDQAAEILQLESEE